MGLGAIELHSLGTAEMPILPSFSRGGERAFSIAVHQGTLPVSHSLEKLGPAWENTGRFPGDSYTRAENQG